MRNWQEKQYKKQLEHYCTKRTFNYIVDLELPPPLVLVPTGLFPSGVVPVLASSLYSSYSSAWIPQQWKPPSEIADWLNENIGIDFYICKEERGVVAFTKPEDAMAFKLQWR